MKFRFNPLTADFANEEDVRYLVVAKIAKLKFYNRSQVRYYPRSAQQHKGLSPTWENRDFFHVH